MTSTEFTEAINAALNEGAKLALSVILEADHSTVDNLFLRNVKFSKARNAKRAELVKRYENKLRGRS